MRAILHVYAGRRFPISALGHALLFTLLYREFKFFRDSMKATKKGINGQQDAVS